MAEKKRVLILGATIWGNRGAQVMLETVIGHLKGRFPDVELVILSYFPKEDRVICRDPSIRVRSYTPVGVLLSIPAALLSRILPSKLLRFAPDAVSHWQCSLVVDVSGDAFIPEKGLKNLYHAATILPAWVGKRPQIKLAQALGLFEGSFERTIGRLFLSRCRTIFARGHRTHEALERLGLPTGTLREADDLGFVYDPAFSLSAEGRVEAEQIRKRCEKLKHEGRFLVALCPSELIYFKQDAEGRAQYIDLFVKLARQVIAQNGAVLLIPHATRAGRGAWHNDILVVSMIAERLNGEEELKSYYTAVDFDLPVAEIWSLLSMCEVALVSRFHAMVGALTNSVPVSVIGWSHKYREVMEEFELSSFVFDYREDLQAITSKFQELLDEREAIRAVIAEKLPEVRKRAMHQLNFLFNELE